MSEKLRTDEISEEEFRRIAGLCSRCGIGRREPGELCELCAQNDAVKLLQINRRNRKAA